MKQMSITVSGTGTQEELFNHLKEISEAEYTFPEGKWQIGEGKQFLIETDVSKVEVEQVK